MLLLILTTGATDNALGLLIFNGLVNGIILLPLQTLRLVVLLERKGLLVTNGLLRLLALQTLCLIALMKEKGLLTFNGLTSSCTCMHVH